ncbi:STAS domain-containing protein [Falsibacillus pallidus]|uniref:RsbT co-antagonist protein RsbR n=1 Tax=Falsibacillus pallidus TaxID=493781 RepID=A0A370GQQ7_9BACI|nr:STAS domain-containing protein [Falsibacillus pallidus]RDI45586.1 rsbT co-antagonist protein RsbR [Falsibacillus pallidus]
MEKELKLIGKRILEQKYEIAKRVHHERTSHLSPDQLKNFPLTEKEMIEVRANFVTIFGEALQGDAELEKAYIDLFNWGEQTGEFVYKLGVPLDEALKDTTYYRMFIRDAIKDGVEAQSLSLDQAFKVLDIIDPLMDKAVYCFSLTYIHFYKVMLESAKHSFLELSVPVVPLTKGIAILPLIGTIDTERAALLMEETLNHASRLQLSHLILDLSGVPIIDTMVADQIFKVIDSLKLLGVQAVITGIRPEIAQTVVQLGLDFKSIMVRSNLSTAMKELVFVK